MFLDLRGSDAITVSVVANRQCEVLRPAGSWVTASSQQEAMRVFREEAQMVRLRCDARVLLEDVTGRTIGANSATLDLLAVIADVEIDIIPDDERKALAIIKGKLS